MRISQIGMRLLDKSFNIRPTEWPRVLLLFLTFAIINAGGIWGSSIAYTTFLKQEGGIEALPWILAVSSTLSILAIAIYTAFVDRITNDRMFVAILAFGIISIVLGLVLLQLNQDWIAYQILYLLNLVWVTVATPHYTTYANSFYDVRSAKRALPVVFSGFRAGAIVAGLTMPSLTSLDTNKAIVVWLLTYVVGTGLIWLTSYLLKEGKTETNQPGYTPLAAAAGSDKQHFSYVGNMRAGFRYITQSTYLRWITTGTLLLMTLLALIEYQSSALLKDIYGTPEEFANFIGMLVVVSNIVALPMLVFGLNRLITGLGLGNASMIFPVGNLIACGSLILAPGWGSATAVWGSATAAYLNRTTFRSVFQFPIDGLLYNAVPLRMKSRARAFVGGLIVPVGTLIGSLLLLLPLWFVSALIGVLAVTYLASTLVIRRQYGQALVKMLEQEDYSFLLSREASALSVADPATLTWLQKKLEESANHEFTVFMAQLISQIGDGEAVPILGQTARATADARTRAAIIDVLVAAGTRGEAVHQLYTDFLSDSDGRVRQSAIAGLERLVGFDHEQFLRPALKMLKDPDIKVRTQILSALAHSNDFYELPLAVETLDQLLAHGDPHQQAQGVFVLGEIADARARRSLTNVTRPVYRLTTYLAAPADQVRLRAALAIEILSKNKITDQLAEIILQQMRKCANDPVERIRQATLVVYGRLGQQESHPILVKALTDPGSQVRAAAVETLIQHGKSVIPIIHRQLNSPDPQLRKMAAVVLGRIDPKEFRSLVNTHLTGNLLTIYHNYGLIKALSPYTQYSGIVALQSVLHEQNQQLIEEIFYLLAAIHDAEDVEIITESLQSESRRTRANAVEALESLTTPQTAQLIAPLFEPDIAPAQLLRLSKATWDMKRPKTAEAIKELITNADAPWLRAIMTFALGEIGASYNANKPKERKTGRPQPIDPLETLVITSKEKKPKKKRKKHRSRPIDLLDTLTGVARKSSSRSRRKSKGSDLSASSNQGALTLLEIEEMLKISFADPTDEVRLAAQAANRMLAGFDIIEAAKEEEILLSTIEKIIFLKEVPFFQGMTINQLEVLANICEEEMFEEDAWIFNQGDPGGTLYVVVNGRVGIEREGLRKGSYARLATLGAHSYFGEMTLFDNGPRSAAAITLQDTLTLRLRREPLIALARQYPDLSLELINVLSQRLREANNQIAKLTRTRPRELQKLFDKLD